jgi:hypothetical protein
MQGSWEGRQGITVSLELVAGPTGTNNFFFSSQIRPSRMTKLWRCQEHQHIHL